MKIRKIIVLLIMAVLLITGCSSHNDAQDLSGSDVYPDDALRHVENTESGSREATENSGQKQSFVFGTFEDGIYKNTYVGYGCTLGEGWVYKSAKELQDISAMTDEMLEGTDIDQISGDTAQITDMMATNDETLCSINVLYTQLTPREQLVHTMSTEEDFIDSTLEQKDALISSYIQMGIDISVIEKCTVEFMGEERVAIRTVGTIQGTNYYMLQLVDINLGTYYVTLTLASYVEDNTAALLELFHPLD